MQKGKDKQNKPNETQLTTKIDQDGVRFRFIQTEKKNKIKYSEFTDLVNSIELAQLPLNMKDLDLTRKEENNNSDKQDNIVKIVKKNISNKIIQEESEENIGSVSDTKIEKKDKEEKKQIKIKFEEVNDYNPTYERKNIDYNDISSNKIKSSFKNQNTNNNNKILSKRLLPEESLKNHLTKKQLLSQEKSFYYQKIKQAKEDININFNKFKTKAISVLSDPDCFRLKSLTYVFKKYDIENINNSLYSEEYKLINGEKLIIDLCLKALKQLEMILNMDGLSIISLLYYQAGVEVYKTLMVNAFSLMENKVESVGDKLVFKLANMNNTLKMTEIFGAKIFSLYFQSSLTLHKQIKAEYNDKEKLNTFVLKPIEAELEEAINKDIRNPKLQVEFKKKIGEYQSNVLEYEKIENILKKQSINKGSKNMNKELKAEVIYIYIY